MLNLLNSQQLAVGAPDFDEAYAVASLARRELQAVVQAGVPGGPPAA